MTAPAKRNRACSVAYLLLFYRQQSGQVAHLHSQLKNYLLFCSEGEFPINEQSVLAFNQQRTIRQFMRFSRFLTLYEQMGRPTLLSTTQLGEMPNVGTYLLSELIQYWYWPPWRTNAEEIGCQFAF